MTEGIGAQMVSSESGLAEDDGARMVSAGFSLMSKHDLPCYHYPVSQETLTVLRPSSDFQEVAESRLQALLAQAQPVVSLQIAHRALSRSSCLSDLRHLPDLAARESTSLPSPVDVENHARLGEPEKREGLSVSSLFWGAGLATPTTRLRIPTRTR
jgi:hypothetical protein